eukprot:m.115991 g.115991  ORF g.115991 m.115991 type:complete len:742 (+) comp14223_c0_seq3:109-2334(+)
MDSLDAIKSPKVDEVILIRGKTKAKGTLFLTATHVIFVDTTTGHEIYTLYMVIHSVKKEKLTKEGTPIIVDCKNFQLLEFLIPRAVDAHHVLESIKHFSFPQKLEDLYAFSYKPDYDSDIDGWSFYSAEAEYKRFGVPSESWVLTPVNARYETCATYTTNLYAPASVKPSTISGSAKFRSKGRFPVLSYVYKNQAAICRCAQPLAGVQSKRSADDEALVQGIYTANPSQKEVIIVDTRPKINAMANKAKGKGFENMQGYTNANLQFLGIENIHCMRDSLAALVQAVRSGETMKKYLSDLESCKWLSHVRSVIDTTVSIVKYTVAGHSVLIHCSDGWDRTAQTCSLAGFMLEPYYRTIRGFIVLVEKEWLGFGHKMSDRNQFLAGHGSEVSPIFLQFLECTWHISQQYPRAFEFNELFLITMFDCLVSSQFGTYLCNSEKERKAAKLKDRTHSVWSYLYSRHEDFLNPLYDIGEPAHQSYLLPELGLQHYQVWTAMYCRFDTDVQPRQNRQAAIAHMSLATELNQSRLKIIQRKMEQVKKEIARLKGENVDGNSKPEKDKNGTDGGDTSTKVDTDTSKEMDHPLAIDESAESEKSEAASRKQSTISMAELTDDVEPDAWVVTSPTHERGGKVLARIMSAQESRDTAIQAKPLELAKEVDVDELEQLPKLQSLKGANSCSRCNLPFEYLAHRQHCRNCGKIFCATCASRRVPIPHRQLLRPVPVCNNCHRDIERKKSQGEKST